MERTISHSWDLPIEEAKALQLKLAEKVITKTPFALSDIQTVAGVDVGFEGDVARAAIVVLDFPGLAPVDYAVGRVPVSFPYIPGLLTFREGPSVLAALEKLTTMPDLYIFDGQGQAHPRRIGLASHMGVLMDEPTIGCAKSRLVGEYQEPHREAGHWTPLNAGEEVIGAVVRTRTGVKPVFVSIGHRVDLATAINVVLNCTRGYRLPETTRYAHRVAGGAELEIESQHRG